MYCIGGGWREGRREEGGEGERGGGNGGRVGGGDGRGEGRDRGRGEGVCGDEGFEGRGGVGWSFPRQGKVGGGGGVLRGGRQGVAGATLVQPRHAAGSSAYLCRPYPSNHLATSRCGVGLSIVDETSCTRVPMNTTTILHSSLPSLHTPPLCPLHPSRLASRGSE